MTLAATLFALGAALIALLTFSNQRGGPEGPVGAHMVTAPLALLLAVALGVGAAGGLFDGCGLPAWTIYAALPGHFVATVILPILPYDRRHRTPARLAVVALLVGGAAPFVAHAADAGTATDVARLAGGLVTLAVGAGGYGVLLAAFVGHVRNRLRTLEHEAQRASQFEQEQARFQREEWAKLGGDAELWQLIGFCHSFDPEVRAQCRSRIAALPDLAGAMRQLLATRWAEHSLSCLRDAYPLSTADLAPALTTFYLRAADEWAVSLRGTNPGSWFYNLVKFLEVAERVTADGGDMRQCMARWVQVLRNQRGLEPLAARAAALAG